MTPEPLTLTILPARIFLSLWTCRPVILDPADPTWDLGNGAAWAWDLLAQEAESCCDRSCFLQAVGGAVKPWEVPVSEGFLGSWGCTPNLLAQCFLSIYCALGAMGCGPGLKRGWGTAGMRNNVISSLCTVTSLLTKLCSPTAGGPLYNRPPS